MKDNNAFLRARFSLLLDHPFFGSLIMNLEPKEDQDAKRGIWVDGETIGYNLPALEAMDLRESAGLLAKGVMHCALEHQLRRGSRDQEIWQQACDFATNPIILESPGLRLPAGFKIDPSYANKSVEEIYHLLEQKQQQQSSGQGNQQNAPQGANGGQGKPQAGQAQKNAPQGQQSPLSGKPQAGQQPGNGNGSQQPQTGEVRDMPGEDGQRPSPAERNNQHEEWTIAMQQAMNNAKAMGTLPASLQRFVEKALTPTVDWKEELRKWFQAIGRDDLSWSKPNRRFIGTGLYLPAVHSEKMGAMVIAVDTSGSIGVADLNAFAGEINTVAEDVRPERIYVTYCDAAVGRVDEFDPDDLPITLKPVGGGGTDFRPVFDWIDRMLDQPPACLVYLTDMMGAFPSTEPEYPVLWASVSTITTAPFGEVVKVEPFSRSR